MYLKLPFIWFSKILTCLICIQDLEGCASHDELLHPTNPGLGMWCKEFIIPIPWLEDSRATHSSILARRIPWTELPGGLQSTSTKTWTWLKQLSKAQHSIPWLTTSNSQKVSNNIVIWKMLSTKNIDLKLQLCLCISLSMTHSPEIKEKVLPLMITY